MQWLNDNVPQIMPCPPNSPDLSPIENVWPLLKNDVEKKECKSVNELETEIVKSWANLDVGMKGRLLGSIPLRLKACRDLKGEVAKLNFL